MDAARTPILIVEDHFETRLVYERYLKGAGFQVFFARSVAEARNVMRNVRLRAIVLDVVLNNEDSWGLLAEWKSSSETQNIPVIVVTAVEDPHKGYGLGADEYVVKPFEKEWLLATLARLTQVPDARRILLIDDDEVFRYLLRQLFAGTPHQILEAGDGAAGLALAREKRPDLIFLDLVMAGLDGFEVLRILHSEPEFREIPVIVVTSKLLTGAEREQVAASGGAILSKETFSSGEIAQTVRRILESMHLADLLSTTEVHS